MMKLSDESTDYYLDRTNVDNNFVYTRAGID